ncbi:unnamed protein product [Mesocestoides corti]|uniref:Otopetrin-2 n=1 Tax=Mesocestoides corti TaxID=53468 RepID=A0A0R3U412_MESCO|nr:unnamed protein product [Mesocestoides corti]
MIMNGFRVADRFNEANNTLACHSELWVPVNVIHSIYVFWQTYFLFKYHRVVFNVQKFFIRFILSHMAVVNLGQWLSTVVQEVMVPPEEELEPKGGISATTLAPSMVTSLITHQPVFTDGNASLLQQMDTSKKNLSAFGEPKCHSQVAVFAHYLIPCGVEYSLIACAIFYKMFQRIGHVGTSSSEGGPDRDRWQIQHSSSRDGGSNNESTSCAMETRHQPKLRDSPTECHHAHKGLFVGLLLVMATLVVMALFYVLVQQRDRDYALVLYQITDLVLLSIGIVTVSVALYQLRVLHLRKLSEEDAFDDNLLLIGLLGMLFYDMFLLVPAVEAKEEHEGVGSIFVAKATLEMVQALLQVFLILEASQRQAGTVDQMVKKPGRTVVTFLLILNLAMWLVKTFELKHAESYPIYRRHYRGIAWKIITHLSLPLIIFFRFHSTVCLADIWTSAYRMHSSTDL